MNREEEKNEDLKRSFLREQKKTKTNESLSLLFSEKERQFRIFAGLWMGKFLTNFLLENIPNFQKSCGELKKNHNISNFEFFKIWISKNAFKFLLQAASFTKLIANFMVRIPWTIVNTAKFHFTFKLKVLTKILYWWDLKSLQKWIRIVSQEELFKFLLVDCKNLKSF